MVPSWLPRLVMMLMTALPEASYRGPGLPMISILLIFEGESVERRSVATRIPSMNNTPAPFPKISILLSSSIKTLGDRLNISLTEVLVAKVVFSTLTSMDPSALSFTRGVFEITTTSSNWLLASETITSPNSICELPI